MAIPFSKYVAITSAVGGTAQASARELILRLMTANSLLPTGTVVEFDTVDEVGEFFTTLSDEYLQAQFYFGFISKLATSPSKISFARYSLVDTAPVVIGDSNTSFAVGDFDAIADATFTLTLGAITEDILINFVTAAPASLADVAGDIEAAVQAANVAAIFASATVTYDAVNARFVLTGGDTGAAIVTMVPTGSGTPLLPIIKWEEPGARFSDGIDAETVTGFLTAQAQISNNFGSYAFIETLTDDQVLESSTWDHVENVKYIYLHRVVASGAQDAYDALNALSGTDLTLRDVALTTDYPWLLPGAIFAATPYSQRASVQNYMYQQGDLETTVSDATLSNFYDSIRVNYYGETQTAGSLLAFYQRGFLMGGATAPIDIGVFANEISLKDSIGVSIFNLFLAVSAVPTNASGETQVLSAIQAPIEAALFNGIISVGKTLNSTQIAFIGTITGDPEAYFQVQDAGYWVNVEITEPSPSEFVAVYTLIYSKSDVVRKVEGSQLLT